jgi:hypothetical protein
MIPKSGYRFSEKIMLGQLEHDPEKWVPVFGEDHAPPKVSPIPLDPARHAEACAGVANPAGQEVAGVGEYQFAMPVVATRTGSGR